MKHGKDYSWQLLRYDEIDSTNSALKRMPDAPHGTVLLARRQTGGRGRLGRQFASPTGGIYLSALLRPNVPSQELLALTPMAAVAIKRAIFDCCGIRVQIKWTNDLVYAGKKLCGILTELLTDSVNGNIQGAIIGIGINCNALPEEVQDMATSLQQITGHSIDQEALVAAILQRLQELDAALGSERPAWLREFEAACISVGKTVQVIHGDSRRTAFAEGIDEFGGLRVRWEDGSSEVISSGEVSIRGMYGYS